MSKEHPKRILVIRFGAIGDIILTFPAIMALKKAWPDAHITYLTKEKFSPLVTPQSFIDDVLCLEPNESIQSLRAKVAAAGIDGIIDLHGQLRSKALRSFNTIPTLAQKIPRSLWESSSVRLGWALHQPKSKIVEDHHRVMDSVVGHRLVRDARHKAERTLRADHQPLDDLDRVGGWEVGESIDRVARRVLDRVLLVDELHERRVRLHAAVRVRARG